MSPYAPILATAGQLVRGLLGQLPLVAAALVALALFVGLATLARRLVRGSLRRADPTLGQMLGQLAYAATVAFGILVGCWIAIPTINFREIYAGLGVTGLILGLALKDLLENFAAGMLILWRRPFRVGDQIRAGRFEGTVDEINFRSTVLRTYDGLKVYVPNGQVFTEPIENLTAFGQRRSTVILGIEQGASVSDARRVILGTLGDMGPAGVLSDPPPAVLFHAVGDFANELHVLYWTAPPNRFAEITTRSEVTERLYEALLAAGIGFPYPTRTVQLDGRLSQSSDGGRPGRR